MTDTTDLQRLSIPFPDRMVSQKQGASYVNHAIVNQRLLGTLGAFDMRIVQVVRGDYDHREAGSRRGDNAWPARQEAIVGVVLGCTFHIDGRDVYVEEVGTPEGYYMADHDGDRLKKAVSDALKRCAMRVGVALDLWSKGAYFLPKMLADAAVEPAEREAAESHDPDAPDPDDAAADGDGAAEQTRPQASAERPAANGTADPGADAAPWDDPNRAAADTNSPPASPAAEVDWDSYLEHTDVSRSKLLAEARRIAKQQVLKQPTDVAGIVPGSKLFDAVCGWLDSVRQGEPEQQEIPS